MKKIYLLLTFCLLCISIKAQDSTWFRDITTQVGMDTAIALRINVTDINNDDYPDIVLNRAYNQRGLLRVYLNRPDTSTPDTTDRLFEDITSYSGVNVHPDYPDSMRRSDIQCLADVNNDGNVDLVTGTWHWSLASVNFANDPCGVMLGDGTGKFTHVANDGMDALGLVSIAGMSFFDYNQDGNIDIYVATFSDDHPSNAFAKDHLMRGNGDGTFSDVTSPFDIGAVQEPNYGVSAVDWNNDGYTDILTSPYCRTGGILWENNQGINFPNSSFSAGYNAQFMLGDTLRDLCQWGAFPYDFDNDGDMDVLHILVHGGIDSAEGRSTLAINNGPAQNYKMQWDLDRIVRNNPQSNHLGNMDATWFDMDNDMLVDLMYTEVVYQPTTDRAFFFKQRPDNHLYDITDSLGLTWVKSPHSVESFDMDQDGDYDLIINRNNLGNKILILENEIGSSNNWIGVKLVAPPGVNGNCIGARVEVVAGGVRQMREVHAGVGHFAGQQPFVLTFGLDQETTVDSVIVHWPSQSYGETALVGPAINKTHEITAQPASVAGELPKESWVVFPNPARSEVFVGGPALQGKDANIFLTDILGARYPVPIREIAYSTYGADVSSLSDGIYLIVVEMEGQRLVKKVMIRK